MTEQEVLGRNVALVRSFYEGGTNREKKTYGEIFSPAFLVTVPDYLPWGGTSNLDTYLKTVLPQVTAVLDFERCEIVSLVAAGDRVVLIIDIGLVGTDDFIQISEHWQLLGGKALSLWVAYFEPAALMRLLAVHAAASAH